VAVLVALLPLRTSRGNNEAALVVAVAPLVLELARSSLHPASCLNSHPMDQRMQVLEELRELKADQLLQSLHAGTRALLQEDHEGLG